jgi:hypothetical protein
MAELGLIANLAGVISLGISVCKGITAYYSSYKNAENDVKFLCEETNSLMQTLQVGPIASRSCFMFLRFQSTR